MGEAGGEQEMLPPETPPADPTPPANPDPPPAGQDGGGIQDRIPP